MNIKLEQRLKQLKSRMTYKEQLSLMMLKHKCQHRRLANLAIDNQRVLATTEARKVSKEEEIQQEVPIEEPLKRKDPKAEAWAEKNTWFGKTKQ